MLLRLFLTHIWEDYCASTTNNHHNGALRYKSDKKGSFVNDSSRIRQFWKKPCLVNFLVIDGDSRSYSFWMMRFPFRKLEVMFERTRKYSRWKYSRWWCLTGDFCARCQIKTPPAPTLVSAQQNNKEVTTTAKPGYWLCSFGCIFLRFGRPKKDPKPIAFRTAKSYFNCPRKLDRKR